MMNAGELRVEMALNLCDILREQERPDSYISLEYILIIVHLYYYC